MVSPTLSFARAETIGRIEIEAKVLTNPGGLEVMWSDRITPEKQELMTARRYFPFGAIGSKVFFRLSGAQIAEVLFAHEEKPVRHLFLRFPVSSLEIRAIRIVPQSVTSIEFESVAVSGEIREGVVLRTPATLEVAADIGEGSHLRFALASQRPASVEAIVTGTKSNRSVEVGQKISQRLDLEQKWSELQIPLDSFDGDVDLQIKLVSADSTPVFCSRPIIVLPSQNRPPNVVLYVVDALRASDLGCYGSQLDTSPFLDDLAVRGTLFENCVANCSWTKPSVASLLTSLSPQTHGLGSQSHGDALPTTVDTIQRILGQYGYLTGSFSANPLASNLSNLHHGFDVALTPNAFARREPSGKVGSEELSDAAIEWMENHAENPFFLYIHSMDPHTPLTEWEEPVHLGQSGSHRRDYYAREIFHNDQEIGRIYRWLEDHELDRQTLFVVTADHGEAFEEHGTSGHGTSTYQEEVHVPLIMVHPDRLPPRRVPHPVQLVDLMPTILAHCGVKVGIEGSRGVDILHSPPTPDDRAVFSTRFAYPLDERLWDEKYVETYGVRKDKWKLVVRGRPPDDILEIELYDLNRDPLETNDVSAGEPAWVECLLAELVQYLRAEDRAREVYAVRHLSGPADASVALSTQEQIELEALGYVVAGE